jgi:hypothetical protein
MNEFDIRKYQNESNILVDGPSALANERDLVISFYHVPSGRSVYFKAFITAFNENYNSNFTPHEAFGRTDPIYQYKNTTRKITLAFKILAASEGEAFENLGRLSLLQQMLYPSYQDLDSATTLNQAPLIRIKVMNLLSSNFVNSEIPEAGNQNPRNVFYNSYKSTKDPQLGLLGIIDNLATNHNLESEDGVFFKREERNGVAKGVRNTILPKFIDVNLGFSPIHEQTIGWKDGQPLQSLFPYGIVSDQTSFGRALQSAVYDRRVELEKQEKIRQQRTESAKAKYVKANGELRMGRVNRDLRRSHRGNVGAANNLHDLAESTNFNYSGEQTDLVFDEDLIDG